MTVVTSV